MKLYMTVLYIFYIIFNNACSTNCEHRTAAKLYTICCKYIIVNTLHKDDSKKIIIISSVGPRGHAFSGVGLQALTYWGCGFESRRRHGCLSPVSIVCCQVEISAMGRSLVQRSPNGCGVFDCDPETARARRPSSTRAVEP